MPPGQERADSPMDEEDPLVSRRDSSDSTKKHEEMAIKPPDIVVLLEAQTGALLSLAIATGCLLMLVGYMRSIKGGCRACREAQRYMDSVGDDSADACDDFYQHVCGRWDNATPENSFVDYLRHHSWIRLRSALEQYPWKTRRLSWTFEMISTLYEHCQRELNVPRDLLYMTERVAEVTGLSWETLYRNHDVAAWIDILLRMSLVYDMRVLLAIDYGSDIGCSLTLRPIADGEKLSSQRVRELLDDATRLLRGENKFESALLDQYPNVVRMHADISTPPAQSSDSSLENAAASDAFAMLRVGSAEDWISSLARYTSNATNVADDCLVDVHSAKGLQFILELFFKAHRAVMALYLYVHLLNKASEMASMAGTRAMAQRHCQREIMRPELFAARYAMSVYTLTSEDVLVGVRTTMAQVLVNILALVMPPESDDYHAGEHPELLQALAQTIRFHSFRSTFEERFLRLETHNVTYAEFPQNLTLYDAIFIGALRLKSGYLMYEQASCSSENPDQAELFAFDVTPPCVAAAVLVPPMYYDGAEHGRNYGALGTAFGASLAKTLLRLSADGSPLQKHARRILLDRVQFCHGDAAMSLTDEAVEELAAYALGVRAARRAFYKAVEWAGLSPEELQRQRRLFLKASCLLTCLHSHAKASSALDVSQLCNVALRHLPDFCEVFGCHVAAPARPSMVCTSLL
ncbi:hypothetical protein HPB49_018726 [Dermacentor silvarum]|uniref:Uncharacterized protein n=1 Tax=Dermacentor silvarum TaxID=543639 RepID=A0ACB8D7T6_DERSI|nr:hypothetical protein HPB49_018726 [Dermacentor silvarum]